MAVSETTPSERLSGETDENERSAGPVEIRGLALAVFGYLNPQIFRPAWFRRWDILSEVEAKNADPLVADEEGLVAFRTDVFTLEISHDRLIVRTTLPDQFTRIRVLIADTFRLLRHTPVHAVGLNWELHRQFEDEAAADRFLDTFAPRAPWSDLMPSIGERRLVLSLPRDDQRPGRRQIELSKSAELEPGVYVGFIDEFDAQSGQNEGEGCAELFESVSKSWDQSSEMSHVVFTHAMSAGRQ
jgi:hypothetical protein